jgi:hypothetical protein
MAGDRVRIPEPFGGNPSLTWGDDLRVGRVSARMNLGQAHVTPAKAGVQRPFGQMSNLDSGFRLNDEIPRTFTSPAITERLRFGGFQDFVAQRSEGKNSETD